ncbi:MAG: serine hydroxymethyltransferase [Tissierellia bacterium]|nr:serine hydroxymethyltransferase [Tissierellia bacterium]
MYRLKNSDPVLYQIVREEFNRQKSGIELIASESYVPIEIMELQGSIFTNKTTEGFPGRRYFAGCHVVDKMENLGIERAKKLFNAEHANIQPHSGSQANQAVYSAVLQPHDTVLGLRLDQGGHLTHGNRVNFSGKIYNFISYGLNKETELIDYEELEDLAIKHRPKLIVTGGSAYPRFIDFKRISDIAESIGAYFMVDMAHVAGLVAAGIYPNPVEYADFVTSTTTKTLCGARGGFILCKEKYAKSVDKGVFPGSQGSAHLHIMAAKAYTFKRAGTEEFKDLMKQVVKNAQKLGEILKEYGLRLVSGGTDSHLLLVDLRPKGITGKALEEALDYVGITVNKNMIPFDPEKPMITSGIRIGTTAITIRGAKEEDMEEVGDIIKEVSENIENKNKLDFLKGRVLNLSKRLPLYNGDYDIV